MHPPGWGQKPKDNDVGANIMACIIIGPVLIALVVFVGPMICKFLTVALGLFLMSFFVCPAVPLVIGIVGLVLVIATIATR